MERRLSDLWDSGSREFGFIRVPTVVFVGPKLSGILDPKIRMGLRELGIQRVSGFPWRLMGPRSCVWLVLEPCPTYGSVTVLA